MTNNSANPTNYWWMETLLKLGGDQADKLSQLLIDLRQFVQASTPNGEGTVLWFDSILRPGNTALQKFSECLLNLRTYTNDHGGDPTGFAYPQTTVKVNWWDGKPWPFVAYAKADCRVWKLKTNGDALIDEFTQSVAATPPNRIEPAGYKLDVVEVWRPGSWPPDWAVVYKTPTYWLVCLLSETTPAP
jgi:hypothetical protein